MSRRSQLAHRFFVASLETLWNDGSGKGRECVPYQVSCSGSRMQKNPIFIDVTTSLDWGDKTAVGIVRVERYLICHLLENYRGRIGFVVFDRAAACYRSIGRDELVSLLTYLYGTEAEVAKYQKPSKLEIMRQSKVGEVREISAQFFQARLRQQIEGAGVPRFFARLSGVAFRNGAALASMAVKLLPVNAQRTATLPSGVGAEVTERELVPFEPYRDRLSGEKAWLVIAGLTWDYVHYPHLHALRKNGRVRLAFVLYDTIPLDFPQFVPNAAHVYHRHFVEMAQTAELVQAISNYSADRFTETVLKPNLLDVPVIAHGLPDFIQMSGDIEPMESPKLVNQRFVLFCSTIEARKNHLLLIHVWLKLLESHPRDEVPMLVFVGKWGWSFETVKNHIDLNPALEGKVLVLSDVSDAELVWLYRNATLSVFPSFAEGWGLAASESLLNGTPVIVSQAPALREASQGLMPALDPMDVIGWRECLGSYLFDDEALGGLREMVSKFIPFSHSSFARNLITGIEDLK